MNGRNPEGLTIKEHWDFFREMTVSENVSPQHLYELKRAYFEGIATMLRINQRLRNLAKDKPVALSVMLSIENEYIEHMKEHTSTCIKT